MKTILTFAFAFATSISAFAFEGIITQTYTNPEDNVSSEFTWYISNDKIRLDIKSGEEHITVIPDFKSNSLIIYGYKQSNDGNYYYLNSSIATIESKVPNMKLLETADSKYKDEAAKEIKLLSSKGMVMTQYLPRVNVNASSLVNYFADSYEFKAMQVAQVESGFPVSGMLMTEKDAFHTLSTNSIVSKPIESSKFAIPSNYKLFEVIK